uniref:Uncharacterized protein n=1 Tax=Cucumis melo TaxID=3656 RepID=A0A9I9EKR8_CUCME
MTAYKLPFSSVTDHHELSILIHSNSKLKMPIAISSLPCRTTKDGDFLKTTNMDPNIIDRPIHNPLILRPV